MARSCNMKYLIAIWPNLFLLIVCIAIFVIFVTLGPANPINSKKYTCGDDTEIALVTAKNTGKVLGTNVWIKIRLRGKQPDIKHVTGGTIAFREIDDVIAFDRNGKKIECTLSDEGYAEPDTR